MSKRSMHASPANLPAIALMLAGTLAPGMASSAPVEQGVMKGFPTAPQLRVNQANAFQPPYLRWSMRHAREVSPTRGIGRASTPLALPAGTELPLDQVAFNAGEQPLTLASYPRWPAAVSAATCATLRASPNGCAESWPATSRMTASTKRCAALSSPPTRRCLPKATLPRPPGLRLSQLLVPEKRWRWLSRGQRALRSENLYHPAPRSSDRQALGHCRPGPARHPCRR